MEGSRLVAERMPDLSAEEWRQANEVLDRVAGEIGDEGIATMIEAGEREAEEAEAEKQEINRNIRRRFLGRVEGEEEGDGQA